MLTQDQVTQFKSQGYTVSPRFLSGGDLNELLDDIEAISANATLANHDPTRMEMEPKQGPEGRKVRRIYEPCTYYPRFRAFSDSPKLLDWVEQLLGHNLYFHYSKINMKPPAIGSVVEWHQDLTYYPLTNRDSLAILFYLDDADLKNGCLQVIPGRHLGPAMQHTANGIFQGRIMEPVDATQAVPLEAPAGSAIFMHAMTPHASAPNTSDKARRTLILSYRAADAFPIHCGKGTDDMETHVRLVRGERARSARFAEGTFPIPEYPQRTKSLYELQEISRSRAAQT